MRDRFALADLSVAVVGAPMAGGPTTPALAAAVANAGGLGFLAGGMLTVDGLAEAITEAQRLTSGALGVNLFVPGPRVGSTAQFVTLADALADEAKGYGVAVGEPRHDSGDFAAKLDVVCDLRPEVVSFTFGAPTDAVCARVRGVGALALATVTTFDEAAIALCRGADAVVVQGPDAGGHRATFDALASPADDRLEDLVVALVARDDCSVVAAGGLATPADVRRVRDVGAAAAQIGTALLLADEAGTNPVHSAALRDPQFTETVVTRSFTGRYARSLRNRFIDDHERESIFGFPEVAFMTAPVQAAAVAQGDPHGTSLWAGAGFQHARSGSAVDIVREMAA